MDEREVIVLCHWNGCIKYGPDGVYYEGSTSKKIRVNQKTELSRLLDGLYLITRLDKQRSKLDIIGRYPVVVSPHLFRYVHFPVVNDSSLKTMLEVPSIHPSINNVELYLEDKPASDSIDPAACSSPLANPSKRQRTDVPVKLERDNSNGWIEDEADADVCNSKDGDMTDKNSGSYAVAQVVNLARDNSISHKDLNKDSNSGVSKPCMSSLWLDYHDLRVGLCFKDSDELKKAVDWCSLKGQQKCIVRQTTKDECIFECIRWKCNWSLSAARMEKHDLFEIIKYTGPHTCRPIDPKDFRSVFEADEIERVVRVQPTQSFAELKKWWKEKIGNELQTSEVRGAKEEAIKRVFGDWDQSFEDFPKLMSAFHLSNGLLVDWKYDLFPNPKFASFCGVFWAFSQSIEGFHYCRPLIVVDTMNLDGEYQLKLMIASGVDAANKYFPLAFAVTKEVSTDSWRWFLTGVREKVTQRKGLCLISSPHPDILAVINEPGSRWKEPWAYPRFCLNHLCSQFSRVFPGYYLESLVKRAGYTSQKEKFDSYMKDIKKDNPEARKWLDKIPPNQWALAHDNGQRYGIRKIDTEALFAVCRGFKLADHVVTGSLLLLFDELRSCFDKSFSYSRSSLNCGDVYTAPVTDMLEELRTSSHTYIVMPLDNNAFQVTRPSQKDEWIVQLSERTCTCKEFQSCKFPCRHALGVCKKLKINPLQYVDECYTLERLYRTYAATFSPVPEVSAWPEASGVPRLFPPVIPRPSTKRSSSVVKEKRQREGDDSDAPGQKRSKPEDETSAPNPGGSSAVDEPGAGNEQGPVAKVRPKFEFQVRYRNRDVHISEDPVSCANFVSKIKGTPHGLPALDTLGEYQAYQDWAQASVNMLTMSNFLIETYDCKLKRGRGELGEASSLKEALAKEREATTRLVKECEALRQEKLQHQQELVRVEDNLVRVEDNIVRVVGEKASLETEMERQMARLRASRLEWVRQERKYVTDSFLAKCTGRFKKLLQHLDDVKRTHDIALWISQIRGTFECVLVMKEQKGVDVPPEVFERLEKDLADWEAKFDLLDVVEMAEADFRLSPLSELPPPSTMPAAEVLSVAIPGVVEFGSNVGMVTPTGASALRTPSGSAQDVRRTPHSSLPVSSVVHAASEIVHDA